MTKAQKLGTIPSSRRRSPKKPTTPEPERTVEVAEHTISKMKGEDTTEIKVETPKPNKYESKPKVGAPTLGRSPNYVTKVGLGNLKVTTAHGDTDV